MKYIYFIQSLSYNEWETGAIIENEISHNPDWIDYRTFLVKVRSCSEVLELFESILTKHLEGDNIVIQIDAHANIYGLFFRDATSKENNETESVSWTDLMFVFTRLYKKFGDNILVILISCLSAVFFQNQDSLHIKLIAAEGVASPRRAEEQLLKFYNSFCIGKGVEEAYDDMVKAFPIENELERESKEKSILRFIY